MASPIERVYTTLKSLINNIENLCELNIGKLALSELNQDEQILKFASCIRDYFNKLHDYTNHCILEKYEPNERSIRHVLCPKANNDGSFDIHKKGDILANINKLRSMDIGGLITQTIIKLDGVGKYKGSDMSKLVNDLFAMDVLLHLLNKNPTLMLLILNTLRSYCVDLTHQVIFTEYLEDIKGHLKSEEAILKSLTSETDKIASSSMMKGGKRRKKNSRR